VRVGQIVKVKVIEVNEKLNRISLSLKDLDWGEKPWLKGLCY
jgi:ribosomal protein S1